MAQISTQRPLSFVISNKDEKKIERIPKIFL